MPPTGPVKTPNPQGGPFGVDWSKITRWTEEAGDATVEFGVPTERILATIVIESGGEPTAIQRNNTNGWSYGLMQVVPRWHGDLIRRLSGETYRREADLGQLLLDDPSLAIRCGAAILRSYYTQHGSWDRASSAFFLGNPDWRGQDTVNGNTGEGYRRSLNGLMEEYLATTPATLPYRMGIIPAGNTNRPGTAMNSGGPRYITVHETGNTRAGANAEMHRVFVRDGGGPDNVSFHQVVDDKEAIQLLPFTEIAFHASDGCDNRTQDLGCFDSIAIETCVNSDGSWEKTLTNLVRLLAKDIRENPTLSADRIRQHNTWAADRKNCPQRLRESGRWDEIIDRTRRELGGTTPPVEEEWEGLPEWCPPAYLKAAFPKADPNGRVTERLIAWIADNEQLPIFEQEIVVDAATNKRIWVFNTVTLLNDGSRVWAEGEDAA